MRHITAKELRDYLDQTATPPLLLDVREPWEFQTCHIEGAQLLPMGRITAELPTLDKGRETVVICHHGVRSHHVAKFLEQAGFSEVINLQGGVQAWAWDVDPQMARY